jgi:pimeloyl-ACP methyl ester carboxylesterase
VTLAFYALRAGEGRALLYLHSLGGSAADGAALAAGWPGPVYALDFAGHGGSGWCAGGAYAPELLAGDADVALARIGTAALAGAGLGAYVALLLAGARRAHVTAALLLPGAGLAGGGALPDPERELSGEWLRATDPPRAAAAAERPASDPFLAQLELDVRPTDYAGTFAASARRLLLLEDGASRPPWWEAAAASASAQRLSGLGAAEALARLAALST